jgi:amino acid adenylation domain-containing protein
LQASAQFNASLFDPNTIQRLLTNYAVLLQGAIDDPDRSVFRLPLLAGPERELLLQGFNRTAGEYPAQVSLQELVEAQVAKTPTAVAATFGEEHLTYAELNARANQLAAHLRSLGVTRNSLVGVCLDRSLDLLIAPLAISKAGGAYLPLDPDHPNERIGPIVEDAGVEILIGRRDLIYRLPKFDGQLVLLDWDRLAHYPKTNHLVAVTADDLAYVIYTSGSTGEPKGVMVPRQALTNLLWSMRDWFQFNQNDVLLALTTIAFDIAGVDVWLPLLSGARILMVDRGTTMDAARLQKTINQEGVTFLQCTPASWKLLLDAQWPGKADLQAVCTGEAMPAALASKLAPRVACLWNMYGPTETTIWSSGYKFSPGDQVLIGRPIANTQLYILDEHFAPTPLGVPGELYIGGDGLAIGYWKNAALTSSRFVPDPFSSQEGARLYKTGDLARYRGAGNIECLGRNDDQIKLRGFRIEPEEIRTAILRHPAIRDAVAVLETSATGDGRIVMYLLSNSVTPPDTSELRSFLRRSLPDYMIPASFIVLESFPLNANGKIDRRALSQPNTPRDADRAQASADEVEAQIRNIFRSVLGLEELGVNEDFFDQGGHSLSAAQLFREINARFQLDLPLATLFHAPTVRGIAALIRDSAGEQMSAPVVHIQRNGSSRRIYCIGGADGELIVFRRLAIELGLDQPLYGLQPFRLLDSHPTVKQLAAAYIRELRKIGEDRPFCIMGYSFGGLVAVEMARQLQSSGIAPPLLLLLDVSYPAGCMSNESWAHRMRRYRFNWNKVVNEIGPSYILQRLRHRFVRVARQVSSTVGVPSAQPPSDVRNRQERAAELYRIKSFRGRVHLFRAELQYEFFHGGRELGWSRVLSDLVVDEVPGDHGSMNTGPNLKVLAAKIVECLPRPVATGRRRPA